MNTSVIKCHAEHEWIDRSDREATDLLPENLDLRAEVEKLKNLLNQSTHKSAAKAGHAVRNGSAVATQIRFEALSDRIDDTAPSASSAPKDFLDFLDFFLLLSKKQTTAQRNKQPHRGTLSRARTPRRHAAATI